MVFFFVPLSLPRSISSSQGWQEGCMVQGQRSCCLWFFFSPCHGRGTEAGSLLRVVFIVGFQGLSLPCTRTMWGPSMLPGFILQLMHALISSCSVGTAHMTSACPRMARPLCCLLGPGTSAQFPLCCGLDVCISSKSTC